MTDSGVRAHPSDRAATPSEPSPETVSGIAGIPCAENVWLSKIPGTDIYAVVGPGGRDIGFVRKVFRTLEKEIPGKMYVAWRRTGKTPSWRWWPKDKMEPGGRYALTRDTRKEAVAELLRDLAIAGETGTAGT